MPEAPPRREEVMGEAKEEVSAELKLILVMRASWHHATAPRQPYMSRESSRQRQWDSRHTHAPRDC